MKGLILAAGRGSRMGDMTNDQPKCFTQLGDRSLLDWQRQALATAGIEEIAIVTGYCADQLAAIHPVTLVNARWNQTNMVTSLMCAKSWCLSGEDHDVIISYSDIIYHPDIVKALKRTPGDIVITYDTDWHALWSQRFDNPLSDAETFKIDEQGRLIEIGQKPSSLDEIEGQYMGLLKLNSVGWQAIEDILSSLTPSEQDRLDITGLLNRLLKAGFPIDTAPIQGRWFEIDSQSDWKQAQAVLKSNKNWTHDLFFLYSSP